MNYLFPFGCCHIKQKFSGYLIKFNLPILLLLVKPLLWAWRFTPIFFQTVRELQVLCLCVWSILSSSLYKVSKFIFVDGYTAVSHYLLQRTISILNNFDNIVRNQLALNLKFQSRLLIDLIILTSVPHSLNYYSFLKFCHYQCTLSNFFENLLF